MSLLALKTWGYVSPWSNYHVLLEVFSAILLHYGLWNLVHGDPGLIHYELLQLQDVSGNVEKTKEAKDEENELPKENGKEAENLTGSTEHA